jgi:hypothetical protein
MVVACLPVDGLLKRLNSYNETGFTYSLIFFLPNLQIFVCAEEGLL